MEYLYSIAKKVKSAGDLAQNENLLTGIFVWVIERYPHLLSRIIERCNFFGQSDQIDNFSLELEKNDLQLYCMDCPLDGSTKFGRLDAVFKGENIALGIENKVVRIGEPNSLQHDQIERYCLSMKRNFSSKWLMLVITPDSEIDAKQELDSFKKNFPGQVCWISWQKIWDVSKDIIDSQNIDDSKKLVLSELKGAIVLANLKPFDGFTEEAISVMEKLNSLDEIAEFLNSVKDLMENDKEISMVEKSKPHREHNGHEYTSNIWPAYIEKNSDGAVYYGPWFRFDKKKFSVYVELDDWAMKAHQRWREKNLGRWEAIKSELEKKWSKQEVSLEYLEDEGYYLTVPIKHNFLKSAKLLEFVKNGVVSLKDDIIKPMGLRKK